MVSYSINVWLLALSCLLRVATGCAGGDYSSFVSAVDSVVTTMVACDSNLATGLNNATGYGASACNAEQATYAALAGPRIAAAAGVCYCKKTYYDPLGRPGATLGEVDLWTTCVGPWNILFVHATQIAVDYTNQHASQLFAKCNACSDTPLSPILSTLEQVESVLDFALDWQGELYNRDTELLSEGIGAVVSAALLDGGVPNGKASPSANFVVATITKGYTPPSNPLARRSTAMELIPRQATGNSSTDPGLQLISQIIEIQVKALMVPVNGTTALLTDQLKKRLSNQTFADSLVQWKANLTSANYTVVTGDPYNTTNSTSSTGTASGTATGTAASASSTNGSASRGLDSLSSTVVFGIFVWLFAWL